MPTIDERCYGHEPAASQLKLLRAAETANATLYRETKRIEQLEKACKEMSSALSRIDYACGEPNEYKMSHYDIDCDYERVVKVVEELAHRMRSLEK